MHPSHADSPSSQAAARAVRFTLNGQPIDLAVPAHATLAMLLRDRLELTGTKIACDQAACGACTVLVDGQAVFACHTLAAQVQGADVVTIEGLGRDGALDPLQQAFIDHDAMQCGFCTPGMIVALRGALAAADDAGVAPDRAAIARAISGNVCRCGAYEHILDAAVDVAARR
jgi:xanthine dehydrogenase YagT iron-sulfur-binding subunit